MVLLYEVCVGIGLLLAIVSVILILNYQVLLSAVGVVTAICIFFYGYNGLINTTIEIPDANEQLSTPGSNPGAEGIFYL